ncbi:molybdopterin molybdotransferase MoeA [Virgibacillus salarius]|uniref:molybdopterin molybdotransferase MoeA n=1 Tax=Virgibacillus salarius TaxID=447199 RepID=UPI00040C49DB|nr:gephyrin-like molybdotransferase Glp [Priestia megaterium]
MVERRKSIKVNEALKRVIKYAPQGSIHYIPIHQSYGHFLGDDLVADHPIPPFDRSPYDGFAVRSKDTEAAASTNPQNYEVIAEIGAGSVFTGKVGKMQAVRIMTGAQVPNGCDAVIMFESVKEYEACGKRYIQIKRRLQQGENISFTGEDVKSGEVLAKKGTYISPGIVALLATFGYKHVPTSKKPTVGIIATGSELLELDEEIQPGKIRNSNAYMVQSQVIRAGGEPYYFGQFSDHFTACFEQVKQALDQVDILITTGGVSVGDYDYMQDIYKELGAEILFNKVGMRPGSVTTVAKKTGKLLFGLSGNPSACFVGFELFTRPAIRKFLHAFHPLLKKETAILGADFSKPNPFDRFVRGRLTFHQGKLVATPIGLDKSNVVSSLGAANVFIEFPAGTRGYKQGSEISVILLDDM